MKKTLMFLILACTFLVNCAQNKSENLNPDNYFPNAVGNKYTYNVVDSVSNTTYTVNVAVVGKTTLPNGQPATIWTYTYPNSIDTNYVFSNKDSVMFYSNQKLDYSTSITNVYHLPLSIGAKWRVSFLGDTSTVISNNAISVNGKTYNNTYLIHEQGHQYNYGTDRDQWYVPNIGMIKLNIMEPINATRQLWVLINYQIK